MLADTAHSWFRSLCVTICTVSLNDCKASHQSLTISKTTKARSSHHHISLYIPAWLRSRPLHLHVVKPEPSRRRNGKHCYSNQRWLSSAISELASQLAYDSCGKLVAKAPLYPPDDRSDAWSCDSTLSTPLEVRAREGSRLGTWVTDIFPIRLRDKRSSRIGGAEL